MKGYIDAFAGTGYRDARRDDRTEHPSQTLLLPDLAEAEPQALLDGSARLVELLKQEFPDLAADIRIRPGDANTEIQELCAKEKDWTSHRAVLFLDPYGMSGRLDYRRGDRTDQGN